MKVVVNGEEQTVKAKNLAELLQELAYDGDWLATAVNAELVPSEERTACALKPDDRIEILSPRQGG